MKKILVVDDNRLLRKFLSTHLEKSGHQVQTAADGFQALDILSEFIPDVMFVDLFMPKIDGDRLCQIVRARKELKHTYVVILSAGLAETGKDYTKIGADACIAKGSFSSMAKNVLAAVAESDDPRQKDEPKPIIGLDAVYSRQLTKELISRNRHLETILESMNEGFLEIFQERVVFANQAAVAMLSISMENLLYAYPPDLFKGDAAAYMRTLIGENSPAGTNEGKTFDLNDKKISIKKFPVEGEPSTTVIIMADVTQQKRLEEKLQQAKKMEAIGTLAGGVAHDFNNLLMGIQGNISLMLLELKEGHAFFDEVKSIERCVESAATLTKQLLGFARGGKYVLKATSLNQLIGKMAQMFQRTNKNIIFHENYQVDLWSVEVDQGQIEQVIMNLLLNACQAMPSTGNLYVQTENMVLQQDGISRFDLEPGRYVKISVIDNGVGMSPEVRQRIFEPFFTTKAIGDGSGMGLASAFGIIKNHGGAIECISQKGKGSTFNIYLPATVENALDEVSRENVVLKGSETILLVDDEAIITKVDRKLLKQLGYRVYIARSGRAALAVFKSCHAKIDLVLLDMVMPDLNGEAVFEKMKTVDPAVKVLLHSGFSLDDRTRRLLRRGGRGFLQKPFKIKELSHAIRDALDGGPEAPNPMSGAPKA